jgi:hypothetical protein
MRVRNPRQGRISEPDQSCGLGSPSKNGRLGDPVLPSLSFNFFHVKHFHPKFLRIPSGGCLVGAGSLLPAGDFCGLVLLHQDAEHLAETWIKDNCRSGC